MKKFIYKNLAVVLSAAIVLCTILPVFSGFVKADTYSPEIITELKESWQALSIKKTLLPSGLFDGTPLTLNDASSYSGNDLADKSVLGEKYISYALTGGDAADTKDRITFKFDEENTVLTIGGIKDFTVYVKSSSSNAIRPFFCVSTGARCNNSSIFNLTAGSFKKLKMSELPQLSTLLTANAALGGIKDRVVTGVDFDFNGTGDIIVGSMEMEFYAVDDATLALASSNAKAFAKAAEDFYDQAIANNYFEASNPEFARFVSALNATKDGSGEAEKIEALKTAWQNLSIRKTLLPSGLFDGTPLTLNDASSYSGNDLADKSVLGEKYISYALTGGDAADSKDRITFKFDEENTVLTIGGIKDFTVYVKSSSSNAIRPFFCVSTGSRCNNSSIFNLTAGSFKKLKMSELPQLSTLLTANGALGGIKDRVVTGVDFDFNGTGDIIVGSMEMEFYAVDDATLALASSDVNAFAKAAEDFYNQAIANNYYADDDAAFAEFTNAINALNDFDGALDSAIDLLADAYSKITVTESLVPSGLFDGTALTLNDSTAFAGDISDKSVLGEKYISYSLTGGDAADTKDRIKFTFTRSGATYTVSQLKDFSVYVYSTSSNAIRPYFCIPTGSRCNNSSIFNLTAGSFKELKMSELPQLSTLLTANAALGGIKDRVVTGVDFDFNGTGDIVIGTMVAKFSAASEQELGLAISNPYVFYNNAKAFYDAAIANNLCDVNNAEFKKFKTALDLTTGVLNSEEYALDKATSDIEYYWSNLKITKKMVPYAVWTEPKKEGEGLTVYDASAYNGSDISDKTVLGPKYATYHAAGGNASDDADEILFTFEEGENPNLPIGVINSFSYYSKTSNAITIRPKYVYDGNATAWNDNATFVYSESEKGAWVKKVMEGVSNQAPLASKGNKELKAIGLDINFETDITVGSITINFDAVDAKTKELKNTNTSLFIAKAMNFVNASEKNNLFSSDDADFIAMKNAISELDKIESVEKILTISKLQAAWLNLSDNSTFPKSDTNEWDLADWIYAACKIDTTGLGGRDEFKAALNEAIDLRDELGMQFTCNVYPYPTVSDAQTHLSAFTDNLIVKSVPTVFYYNGTEKTEIADVEYNNMLDDDFDTVASVDTVAPGSDSYVEFVYRFEGQANVSDFVVGAPSSKPIGKYRIYVADSMDKLASAESIVASYDNANSEQVQIFNYAGKPSISGSYVALRIYTDGVSVDIGEFGVYGTFLKYTVSTGSYTNEQMSVLGENLLAKNDTVAYVKGATGAKTKWSQANLGYEVQNLTDCNNDTVVGIGGKGANISVAGEEITFHIFFDLKETYYIKQLLINHYKQAHLQTGKYEIYASTDYATLFKSSSRVVTYNNMVDSENGTTETQLFTALGDGVIARYVSFCIKVPVNDYDKSISWYGNLCYPRLNDLAVYGERYYKPLKEVNFLGHMPVEVYRSDASGNKEKIKEDEYGGLDYLNAADGIYDIATPIAQNGNNIDFVFNLCANKSINSVKLTTLTENVSGLSVYVSEDEEGVWNKESMVLDYYNANADSKEISKTFGEMPIYARYIRFSISHTVNGTFDPTEFEVIGWNRQEFVYMNLAEEKSDQSSIWLENKDTYDFAITSSLTGKYNAPWNGEDYYDFMYAFDGDIASAADLYNGSRGNANGTGRNTINILVDLGSLNAVDNISYISGGRNDYWPSKLNFYLGEDDLSLFGKDAKPIKEFTSKTEDPDGKYSFTFLPQIAQYIRIEIVEGTQKYFEHNKKIGAIISEIQVNGLEILGYTASEGLAASITDEETGIRVDLVALRDNDVYSALQDILVIKRESTEEEKLVLKEQGVAFASEIYDIYLLDSNGNIISNVDGREIRVCMPQTLFHGTGEAYIVRNSYGEPEMVEHTVEDNYYITILDEAYGMSFAFCEFVNFVEDDDNETPENMDNTLTDEDDETESQDEAEDDDDKPKRKKKIKVVRKNNGDDFDYLWIIIPAIAVAVVLAAGITIFLILKKKKNREEESSL